MEIEARENLNLIKTIAPNQLLPRIRKSDNSYERLVKVHHPDESKPIQIPSEYFPLNDEQDVILLPHFQDVTFAGTMRTEQTFTVQPGLGNYEDFVNVEPVKSTDIYFDESYIALPSKELALMYYQVTAYHRHLRIQTVDMPSIEFIEGVENAQLPIDAYPFVLSDEQMSEILKSKFDPKYLDTSRIAGSTISTFTYAEELVASTEEPIRSYGTKANDTIYFADDSRKTGGNLYVVAQESPISTSDILARLKTAFIRELPIHFQVHQNHAKHIQEIFRLIGTNMTESPPSEDYKDISYVASPELNITNSRVRQKYYKIQL